MPIATSSPGRFSLALEVGREKRPGDEVVPIADRRVPSNYHRNNCRAHFSSISLFVSKVANYGPISTVARK